MLDRITAPFTPAQVDALNAYQREGRFHPFTCGGDRGDAAHAAEAEASGSGEPGLLVATPEGFRCPACSYTQPWAHAAMAGGSL